MVPHSCLCLLLSWWGAHCGTILRCTDQSSPAKVQALTQLALEVSCVVRNAVIHTCGTAWWQAVAALASMRLCAHEQDSTRVRGHATCSYPSSHVDRRAAGLVGMWQLNLPASVVEMRT